MSDVMGASFNITAPHTIVLTAIGSNFTIKVDNVVVMQYSDTEFKSGYVGLRSWYISNNKFHDIKVVDLTTSTVTFDSKGGSSINDTTTITNNMISAPYPPTKTGYTFAGWYKEASCANPWNFASDIVKGNITLYANWTINTYTVTFNTNGGSYVSPQPVPYNGLPVKPTPPTNAGSNFGGWYHDSALTHIYDFDNFDRDDAIIEDTTIYAKWDAKYTVSFNALNGVVISPVLVASGDLLAEPTTPTKTGYTFAGWYTNSNYSTLYSFSNKVLSSFELYAKWNENSYTVTFDSQGGTPASTAQTVLYNGLPKEPISDPIKGSYKFGGWFHDSDCKHIYDFDNFDGDDAIVADTTIYAKWDENLTVSFNALNGVVISPVTVVSGGKVTEPSPPTKTGYTFAGWYTDSNYSTLYIFSNLVSSSFELYAKWDIISYTVTFDSMEGSAISPQIVDYNGLPTVPVTPTRTNYKFGGWYHDLELTHIYDFDNFDGDDRIIADTTIYAKWDANYTVSFNAMNGDVISPVSVVSGGKVTEPASPIKTGYNFVGWYTDSEYYTSWNFNNTVSSSFELYAKWNIIPYTVTFDSQGGSTVSNQSIAYNGLPTVPATPTKTGYNFGGWFHDYSCNHVYDFDNFDGDDLITANTTIFAKWDAKYTVSFNALNEDAISPVFVTKDGYVTKPTPDPTKTGYEFVGWYVDSYYTNAWDFANDKVTNSFTLHAKWNIDSYPVTFNTNGGNSITSVTVNYNNLISEPAMPIKSGYMFDKWYKNPDLTEEWNFASDLVTANKELYAKWIPIPQYTVTVQTKNGDYGAIKSSTFTPYEGETVTFTITPNTNYKIGVLMFDDKIVFANNSGVYAIPGLYANGTFYVTYSPISPTPPTIVTKAPSNPQSGSEVLTVKEKTTGNDVQKTIAKSFINYATINNPDNVTLIKWGFKLTDVDGMNNSLDIPASNLKYNFVSKNADFALRIFGDGFVTSKKYAMKAYLTYEINDEQTTVYSGENTVTW